MEDLEKHCNFVRYSTPYPFTLSPNKDSDSQGSNDYTYLQLALQKCEDYNETGLLESLNQAIEFQEQWVSRASTHHLVYSDAIGNLGTFYNKRFEHLESDDDLRKAIECLFYLVQSIPRDHKSLPIMLNNLAIALNNRSKLTGRIEDNYQAIDCLKQAIALDQNDSTEQSSYLSNLGNAYLTQYQFLGRIGSIEESISALDSAVALAPVEHTALPSHLNNLGVAYAALFDQKGLKEDLDRAFACHSYSVYLTPSSSIDLASRLSGLGNSYQLLYERSGDLHDINRAIEHHSQAVFRNQQVHANRPSQLFNLGNSHTSRFEHLAQPEDIEKAIRLLQETVLLTPFGHPELPARLSSLGSAHTQRFAVFGGLMDINNAIELHQAAVSLTPVGHADMLTYLGSLGNAHCYRFNNMEETMDIHRAIECLLLVANKLTRSGHYSLPSSLLNLSAAYLSRSVRIGSIEDVDLAIENLTRAAALPAGLTTLNCILSNISSAYTSRYERLHRAEDLDEAIHYETLAIKHTPKDHIDLSLRLSNLGLLLGLRFDETGRSQEDLNKSIKFQLESVNITPKGYLSYATYLGNLGNSYCRRFATNQHVEDINKAVDWLEKAIEYTPKDHADLPARLADLSNALSQQFDVFDNIVLLERAIDLQTRAVSLVSENQLRYSRLYYTLGGLYITWAERSCNTRGLAQAVVCFRLSAQSQIGYPRHLFNAACCWALVSSNLSLPDSLDAFQVAINYIPQLIWLGTTVDDRYKALHELGDITQRATAAAINNKNYGLALEWYEQGRSIVWNQISQLRSPHFSLLTAQPILASQLNHVTTKLWIAGSTPTGKIPDIQSKPFLSSETTLERAEARAARQHRNLAAEYERLLSHVRQIPGFDDFLLPKKVESILSVVSDGPIVIVNVHESQCDALILRPGNATITHVSLPNLLHNSFLFPANTALKNGPIWRDSYTWTSKTGADSIIEELRTTLSSLMATVNNHAGCERIKNAESTTQRRPLMLNRLSCQELRDILAMLWVDLVNPILKVLEYRPNMDTATMPRITWCTTGQLAFLPIHAAGLYNSNRIEDKLYNYAISSYIPTVSSLLLDGHDPLSNNLHTKVLAVGLEETPGHTTLSETTAELSQIERHIQPGMKCTTLTEKNATTEAVLDAMESHNWVHFACHAHQDNGNPTGSGFFLYDDVLSIATINHRRFKNKGLAYLSACQTAMGDKNVADEAVHLASAMLMAGYPSVIATMWSILDADGPVVANEVYKYLLEDGKMNHKNASRALHMAVAHLRQEVGEDEFHRWVPFIHIGA